MEFLKKYYKILSCIGLAVLTLLGAGASWYKFDATYCRAETAKEGFAELGEEILIVKADIKQMVNAQQRAALYAQLESLQKQIWAIENHYREQGQDIPAYDRRRIQDMKLKMQRIQMELSK